MRAPSGRCRIERSASAGTRRRSAPPRPPSASWARFAPTRAATGSTSSGNKAALLGAAACGRDLKWAAAALPRSDGEARSRLRRELVADAAHRHHQLGVLGVALDLLAQVRDVDVAGAHVAPELGLPQLLHDLLAGEDLARALRQQPQHLELRPGQVDGLAADRDQMAGEID